MQGGVRRRFGALARKADGIHQFSQNVMADLLGFFFGQHRLLDEELAEAWDRVAGDPLLDFFLTTIVGLLETGMAAPLAIGFALDQRRAFLAARPCHRFASGGIDRQHIVAIYRNPWEAVRRGAIS